MLGELAETLLPQRCVACGRFGAALHPECVALCPPAAQPRCTRCWQPSEVSPCARCRTSPPPFEALRTPFAFEGPARRALLEAKFQGVTAVLAPLAEAAADVVPTDWRVELVVPVPLHPRRERQRGYNQAALLAEGVARRLGAPVEAGALRRLRATPPQAGLDLGARSRNLEGAFACDIASVQGRRVLLVDDITTTGATFAACARTLLDGGAASVVCLAITRED